MKKIVFVIFLLQFLWIANGCKKKEEEKPYEPVKQKFTDIPGTDCYIANTDTAFVDTGLVITVKGKGFDPKYKEHYTIFNYDFTQQIGYGSLPEDPKIIFIDETTIVFKYSKNYFRLDSCESNSKDFILVKYSDDPIGELNYQKRFIGASPLRKLKLRNFYEIKKDTVFLQSHRFELSDFFVNFYSGWPCDLSLKLNNGLIALKGSTGLRYSNERECHLIGISLDSNYNINDGYYQVKLLKDGKELYRAGDRNGVYVKNVK